MISERLFQFTVWGVRKVGVDTLISLLLSLVVMGSISFALKEIAAIQPDTSLILFAILAVLTGWLLAMTTIPGWGAALSALGIGTIVITIHTAHMSARLIILTQEFLPTALWTLKWQPGYPLPDYSLILLLLTETTSTSGDLLYRLVLWLRAMLVGAPTYDPVAATFVWGFLVWGVSFWAGWAVRRWGETLIAVIPGITILAFGMAHTRVNIGYLIPVVSATLLLFAWIGFSQRKQQWDRAAVDYAEDIHVDVLMWTTALIIGIVTFASIVSWVSPQNILKYVRALNRTRSAELTDLGDSLGLVREPANVGNVSTLPAGELPREHLIGSGPELSRRVVMIIEPGSLLPGSTEQIADIAASYRWSALNYDIYTGRGWTTSATYSEIYSADVYLAPYTTTTQTLLDQNVQVLADIGNYVYFTGSLVSVDQDQVVTWRTELADIQEPQPRDMFGATLDKPGVYRASSLVNNVGNAQLIAAGDSYPAWISERYLQLPDSIPERVVDLAEELTAGYETPYEKALALETYLRQIPYNLDITAPPEDRDVVDYFIFDLREGYCDYYATSMAVMGRIAGLPTRLVMGYATGIYDESQGRLIITAKDAHSWVEVYFLDIGWVEFEPTGGLPGIVRPDSVPLPELPISIPGPSPPSPLSSDVLPWLVGISAGIFVLAMLAMLWLASDRWRLRRMPKNTASITLYRRLVRHGRRFEVRLDPSDTPHEYNQNLIENITALAAPRWASRWQDFIHAIKEETQSLVDLYTQTIYSPKSPERETIETAVGAWGSLRWRLLLARILRMIQGIKDLSSGK